MSADVSCDPARRGEHSWREQVVESRQLREQSRRLLQRAWREVALWENTVFVARLNLARVRQEWMRLQTNEHSQAPSELPLPRFALAQAVSLDQEFDLTSWLYGIVVSHRWRESAPSARGTVRSSGWAYKVQFGDSSNLFEEWIDEKDLYAIPPAAPRR